MGGGIFTIYFNILYLWIEIFFLWTFVGHFIRFLLEIGTFHRILLGFYSYAILLNLLVFKFPVLRCWTIVLGLAKTGEDNLIRFWEIVAFFAQNLLFISSFTALLIELIILVLYPLLECVCSGSRFFDRRIGHSKVFDFQCNLDLNKNVVKRVFFWFWYWIDCYAFGKDFVINFEVILIIIIVIVILIVFFLVFSGSFFFKGCNFCI